MSDDAQLRVHHLLLALTALLARHRRAVLVGQKEEVTLSPGAPVGGHKDVTMTMQVSNDRTLFVAEKCPDGNLSPT